MKAKTCSIEGCRNPIWGNGLCRSHGPKSPLSTKRAKTVGAERINKRNAFFSEIWKERPHVCQNCGTHLGYQIRSYMFDHLLEKEKYPQLEFEKENIWMVCLECHDNKSRGFISDKYREKINFVATKFGLL